METAPKPYSLETPEAEVEESINFDKSLQELRELRSQLHHAADYCETAFLKGKEKTHVVENTKEYLCRAVVTVIDHLGNVSANLECLISQTDAFSEAELRINSLKQRLLSCEQYADKLALTNMQWSEKLPRFHSRYLSSTPTLDKSSSEKSSDSEGTLPCETKTKDVTETMEPLVVCPQKSLQAQNKNGSCSRWFVSIDKSSKSYVSFPMYPESWTPQKIIPWKRHLMAHSAH
ncbi:probable protein ABIL5 isoform X2 [Prosopis cineraria]|uniref:probable protein ABIL5 isoform X2 n=1 Tax=Prosopis cineraria TaxID=364024 RepID=UPI00240FBFAE|nr:probable protein ABIL5 isoform X2 [Prosopis cineraria]